MIWGPYRTTGSSGDRMLSYIGNQNNSAINDISNFHLNLQDLRTIVSKLPTEKYLEHLHFIDAGIFNASFKFFNSIGATWCNLPLTTRMISSPGEVYKGNRIDYTTDTLPVRLKWFDHEEDIFLSESSQFYLELRLLIPSVSKVFSIYNSFRKEPGDFTHLSEFQHIEFEGKVSFSENTTIAVQYLRFLVNYLLEHHEEQLLYFRSSKELDELSRIDQAFFETMSFKEALGILHHNTQDSRYEQLTLKHFGAWEEVRLTELVGKAVIITEFPPAEIPFYHNENELGTVAENADIILPGYREVIGSGVRISDKNLLLKKSKLFNLPVDHYRPYLQSREVSSYRPTSGFGMGWQRFTHWLLSLPAIWNCSHVPRTHLNPEP